MLPITDFVKKTYLKNNNNNNNNKTLSSFLVDSSYIFGSEIT
jgi:hypothetical protein